MNLHSVTSGPFLLIFDENLTLVTTQIMIDLSKNENPFPIPSRIVEAISAEIGGSNRYPVDLGEKARAAAAACFDVSESEIILTRGIDGAVDDLIKLYSDRTFFVVKPGFNGFVERLRANRIPTQELRLDADFRLPLAETNKLDDNSFVLLASPNNPTGRRFSESELESVLVRSSGMLIDQSYEDFTTRPAELPLSRENVYRFRSYSKGLGLAALRIGALIGMPTDIKKVSEHQQFCHLDSLACKAVIALADKSEYKFSVSRILRQRHNLTNDLRNLGLDVLEGDGNFILVRHSAADHLYVHLKHSGILVKNTEDFGLPGFLRISVGMDRDHQALVSALSSFEEPSFQPIELSRDRIPNG